MMSNHLFLNRLRIVTENGAVAYDEQFHKGVNIIRGDNSSGKSTITHFIFYALGGDFSEFVPEARKCATVFAEVETNGTVFTIKRDIIRGEEGNISKRVSMSFFFGNMNESLNPPADKTWQRYGYNTTENRKSFSNVLFDFLDLPVVKGDANITFHQILRLLYIDQDSPTNSLFYYEQFDSQITRETVSDLLLGVYNEDLYEKKRRLISAEKELDEIKSEIKATKKILPKDSLAPNFIKAHIDSKEKKIATKQDEIIAIRQKSKNVLYEKTSKLNFQKLNEDAIEQRHKVAELEEQISLLHNEIEDSDFFIKTLKKKIEALRNSIETREFLGHLPLEYCPECLTKIKTNEDKAVCKLCKEPIDESYGVVQAKRMELEIGFQLNESKKLFELNKKTLLELEAKYTAEIGKLQDIQKQVNAALVDVKSFDEETVDELNREKGFLEGEILQYRTMLESAELYDKLIDKKNELEKEIESLKRYIYNTEKRQIELKTNINNQIREEGVYLLNHDLDRQDEFKNARDFFIDYSNNIAFLSNRYSKYSASSNFYLKVSARFALFLASLRIADMRFPRFIFADNMEDKGIEMPRAQNFQKLLIDRVQSYDANSFQMIYTTSYITEELNNSPYVVGEYYTKDNPSLKNIPKY
ncbi:MAG: hypothetical protein EZS26_000531 [Candidatus Ordinivivax streblomastigis]|uniref:Rad50/SbcC-type AAA domain-containing protein n=1 Tax=Candidatus Ordinivivax streblomastigis TaxID=2540710 RepID=A0A5M8P4P4_9BACT|nr:MAG: hypothetical protein EZS26_000436 [Candidatus Ordinivivax streblomastigis]KAA6303371.1 MAG: hypothetical protein EZS26_000531 [Candidatus Ordinivivax streblomastigis]